MNKQSFPFHSFWKWKVQVSVEQQENTLQCDLTYHLLFEFTQRTFQLFILVFRWIFLLALPWHKHLGDENERGTLQVHCFQFEAWSTTAIHSKNAFIDWLIGVFCFENGPVLV